MTRYLAAAVASFAFGGDTQAISSVVSLKTGGFALVDANGRTVARGASIPVRAADGTVAVAVREGARYRIELGGRVVARLAGPDIPVLAFSSDGTKLAIAGNGGLRLVGAGTRSPKLPAGRFSNPAFSPDGSLLAFVQATGDGRAGTLRASLRIVSTAGGAPRTLHAVADPYNTSPRPVFTPDGARIAFILGDRQIVTVPVDGGPLESVTEPLPRITLSNLVALPDGFVFGRTPERSVTDVWRVDGAGRVQRLTTTGIPAQGRPRYGTIPLVLSPDGTQLLVAQRTSLAVLSLRGDRLEPLRELGSQPLAGYWLEAMHARIVYSSGGELVVREPDGRHVQLTHDRVHDGLPSWSPDGTKIAFTRAVQGSADIYVANADGSAARALAGGALRGSDELYPAWSPDGRLIAFSSYRNGSGHVYVMGSDGSDVRRLTNTPAGVDNFQPRFSPDGRSIVFASTRGIVRVRTDGSGEQVLASDGLAPDYSPDGKRIAYISQQALWTMSATGGDRRVLVRHTGMLGFPRYSPDGSTILYSRDSRLRTVCLDGSRDTEIGAGAEADW